jgi:hypothetical protein
MSSLEAELQRWALRERQQQQRRAYAPDVRAIRQQLYAGNKAAVEAPKMNGVKLTAGGSEHTLTLDMLKTPEGRAAIREVLALRIADIRADRAHPYNDARHPDHAAAVRDVQDAYRFNNYEMPDTEITEMATKLTGTSTTPPSAPAEPFREIAAIVGTPEGRVALQRRATGQPLDASQKAIVARHDELEAANNSIAYRERAVKSGTHGPRPYIPSDAMAWISNPHKEQRRQLAAEWKAKTLADPTNDYWHADRGARHRSAMLAMKAAYEAAETGEVHSVQINPADGTVSGEE